MKNELQGKPIISNLTDRLNESRLQSINTLTPENRARLKNYQRKSAIQINHPLFFQGQTEYVKKSTFEVEKNSLRRYTLKKA